MATILVEKTPVRPEPSGVVDANRPASSWLWWTLVTLVGPLLLLGPLLVIQAVRLWQQPAYRSFAFAVVANLLIALWHHRPALPSERRFRVGSSFLLASTICGLVALLFFMPSLAMVAAVGFFAGWMMTTWGLTRLSRIAVVTASWLVLVPLGVMDGLVDWFQQLSAGYVSSVLDAIGILHYQDGATILCRYFALPVTRIGGSVDSPIFFASVVLVLLAMRWHGWFAGMLMVVSVPLWFLIYSVSCGILLTVYGDWQGDEAVALPFTAVRLLMLAVVFAAVIAWDMFLVGMTRPSGRVGETLEWQIDPRRLLDRSRVAVVDGGALWGSRRLRSTLVVASAALVLASAIAAVCIGIYPAAAFGWHEAAIGQTIAGLDRDALPAEVEPWVRVDYLDEPVIDDFGGQLGRFRWLYQKGDLIGDFSLVVDPRWELSYDVSGQGLWRASSDTQDDLAASWRQVGESPIRVIEVQNRFGQEGLLVASRLDSQGRLQDILADAAASVDPWRLVWQKLRQIQRNDGRGIAIASLLVRPVQDETENLGGELPEREMDVAQPVDPAQVIQLYRRFLSLLVASD